MFNLAPQFIAGLCWGFILAGRAYLSLRGLVVKPRQSQLLATGVMSLLRCARNDKRSYSSKYKGVTFSKKLRKWRAEICFNGVKKHLGYYEGEVAAAKEYDRAAMKYHGRFARLNFPKK